jgi:hypothetical protein
LRARLAEAEAKLKEIDTKAGGFISTDPRANNPAEWPTREEADRVLDRLNSSDPDFDACAAAAALIYKLVSQVQGPPGFATWQDAAVDERMRRIALAARLAEAERELAEALRLLSVMPGHGLSAFESDDWWNARATWLAARRS